MKESDRFPTDDITWCMAECSTDCPRQPRYIRDKLIPHSFADFSKTCMAYVEKGATMVIKCEHPNGYSGVLMGKSTMLIYDKDGHECLHTCSRTPNTEEELYEVLETMPRMMEIVAKEFEQTERSE